MTDPTSRLGAEAMAFADHLRDTYGEAFTLGDIIIVADVVTGDANNPNPVATCSSDPRRWVQHALLKEAMDVAESMNARREEQQLDSE